MLDMNRIITGRLRLDISKVNIAAVINAAVQSVQHAADARGVTIQHSVHPRPPAISGDANRLQQVFWNLLSNAVKFTPIGGHVFVTAGDSDGMLEITVRDTGVGIKAEFLPHVFERFSQADSSTRRQYTGLGLGLGIVKHIAELHGGHVRGVSAGEGKGSTFTVLLPTTLAQRVDAEPHADEALIDLSAVLPSDRPSELVGLRVLVVDDEEDARNMLTQLLTDCAAVVAVAGSVEEALLAFDQGVPDVLVSDIGMPDADGYDLIKAVRKRLPRAGRTVPAVAVTAFARSEDRRRALTAGFDMHVAKPIEPAELLAVVARLGSRRLD